MRIRIALFLGTLAAHILCAEEGNFHGSITTGFRFVDIAGYQPKYQELFDLNGGLRLLDFNLAGEPGKNRFADHYSASLSGIGGDPYSSTQINVRKAQLYDLRIGFRQSHYY